MSNSIPSTPPPPDIKTLLAEFDCSGQSPAAFARSKGLPPWKLYGALRRRSGKARSGGAARRSQSAALLPVRVVDAKPAREVVGLDLVLAGGHRVVLGPDFDVATLRRLLQALTPC